MRQRVELARADHVVPQVDAGSARDLDAVERDVRRAAHRDRHRESVPQRRGRHDIAGLDAFVRHRQQTIDQLAREFVETAWVVRRRRDHVQGLHAEDRDEGLHRVVREHAATASLAGTGMERHLRPPRWIRIARHLKRRDEIDPLTGLRIDTGLDRAIGKQNRRLVVLEHRSQRADGRLVARDDGDEALHLVRVQVGVDAVVRQFASNERKPHALGAVQLSVGHADRVRGRDQADRQIVAADTTGECRLDGFDFARDADVALAVTEVPRDRPDGLMDLVGVLSEKTRGADALDVAPRVPRYEALLPGAGFS